MDRTHIRREVQHLAEKLSQELSADYTWKDDKLVFERKGAKGYIEVGNDEVFVEIHLSLVFSPLKGHIEKTVVGYLEKHLA